MGLDALLAMMERRGAVTHLAPRYPGGVTAKTSPVTACTPVTPATPRNDNFESDAAEAIRATTCKPIHQQPTAPLSVVQETEIRAWLAHIEEDDLVMIAHVLNQCRADTEARHYFLRQAREVQHQFLNCTELACGQGTAVSAEARATVAHEGSERREAR